ncbi:autoinducer binding domain-containing protein [Aminobacter sp. MET-1]|uniref:autoinducer binding domain-containing protein n=1 Tax=Aminobacter sp. MET-1 TaxID=2951085 RepID=UPI00226AD01D|nr:autoinducer binding domain-containing protein [Aminobacter sp. MET-1]MCX8570866.1 autoinducer binding domain-containing protein [Aminobacter sp. MET-1]
MDGQITALIDALDISKDQRSIRGALKSFSLACGYERFAYFEITSKEISTINSYPLEWQHDYLRNQFARIDPVVTTAKRLMQVFTWSVQDWPSRCLTTEEKRFRSMAKEYGLCSGLSIPVLGSYGSILMLSLTSARQKSLLPTSANVARAEQAVLYVHHRLRAISDSDLMSCSLTLTSQEAVCLKWAAKGKYMREISIITNLQYRTVQFYLDNARKKLDAANLVQAVSIAKDKGII